MLALIASQIPGPVTETVDRDPGILTFVFACAPRPPRRDRGRLRPSLRPGPCRRRSEPALICPPRRSGPTGVDTGAIASSPFGL